MNMMFRANVIARTASVQMRLAAKRAFASPSVIKPTEGGSVIPNALLRRWYNTFGRSSSMYATWLISLIVVGEYATGNITDRLWTWNNYGKTYNTVDWSKFDSFEDEEGEEDEDEDEDDE